MGIFNDLKYATRSAFGIFRWSDAVYSLHRVRAQLPVPSRANAEEKKYSLSDLLDSLDGTFDGLTKRIARGSGLDREARSAFRKLGPLVLHSGKEFKLDAIVDHPSRLPTFIFVSMANRDGRGADETKFYPEFVYVQKYKKLPFGVEFTSGIVCEVSVGIRASRSAKDHEKNGASRTFWTHGYISIDRITGAIRVLQYRHPTWVSIKHRRGGKSYVRGNRYDYGTLVHEETTPEKIGEWVGWAIRAHMSIGDNWTVGVRKDRARATFLVGGNETKTYFRNRDRTALCPDGSIRRIIHHVRQHARVRADGKISIVPEHIRGARRFTWNGYECAITAPKFHVFDSRSLTTGAVDVDDKDDMKGMIGILKVAKTLADYEDFEQQKKAAS